MVRRRGSEFVLSLGSELAFIVSVYCGCPSHDTISSYRSSRQHLRDPERGSPPEKPAMACRRSQARLQPESLRALAALEPQLAMVTVAERRRMAGTG